MSLCFNAVSFDMSQSYVLSKVHIIHYVARENKRMYSRRLITAQKRATVCITPKNTFAKLLLDKL